MGLTHHRLELFPGIVISPASAGILAQHPEEAADPSEVLADVVADVVADPALQGFARGEQLPVQPSPFIGVVVWAI